MAVVKKNDPLQPSAELLMALGSALVHADEFLGEAELGKDWRPAGHPLDYGSFRALMDQPIVRQWLADMGPLLPLRRGEERLDG